MPATRMSTKPSVNTSNAYVCMMCRCRLADRNWVRMKIFFTPELMAGKARAYGMHTDASHRFERGADPGMPPVAVDLAAALIAERKGDGSVILFADDPNFRGIWYGTNKLFLNALFFSNAFEPPRE